MAHKSKSGKEEDEIMDRWKEYFKDLTRTDNPDQKEAADEEKMNDLLKIV